MATHVDLQARLQAALSPSYQLESELGGGGMSRVFVATETALGRRVVIKVLPPELAAGLSIERFRREIQLAASLQHPHIVPLLAAGPAGDMLYYTMPLIEGESLRTRIAREGELPIGVAVRILRDVVDALACAHEHNIVHRDIKPDNVLLSRHHGLVADFGVAKALSEATGPSSVTSTGLALGTPAYMAPEQATADPHVDHRADIYAVGALAYEMLTGRPPFTGSSPQAVLAAHVTREPEPVSGQRPSVPPILATLVMRCLAKRPADRFQSADELLHLLEAMATPSAGSSPTQARPALPVRNRVLAALGFFGRNRALYAVLGVVIALGLALSIRRNPNGYVGSTGTPPGKMIVVLPFENRGRPEDAYFADGITEEITNRLTGLGGLRVISRSSAKQYKDSGKPLKQIGAELGANYALVGTVRWEGVGDSMRVRVSPELINLADETNLWAQRYDAVMAGIFRVQSNIADEVARALNIALTAPDSSAIATRETESAEAYDYYLKGREYLNRTGGLDESDLRSAEVLFRKAIEGDSAFALAWSALADVHDGMYWFYYDRTDERLAQQKAAAERALRLQPQLPEAHVALAYYHYHGKLDYAAALNELEQARRLRPGDSEIFNATGLVQRRQGNWEDALRNLEQAASLDPRSAYAQTDAGETAMMLRDYKKAERYFQRALTVSPDQAYPYIMLATTHLLSTGDSAKVGEVIRTGLGRAGPAQFLRVLAKSSNWSLLILAVEAPLAVVRQAGILEFGSDIDDYYLLHAEVRRHQGQPAEAHAYADSAREVLERSKSLDAVGHGFLGWALALQGRKTEAIRHGRTGVEMMPFSRDAMQAPAQVWLLGRIYTLVGEPDSAAAQLKTLLSVPSLVSIPELRINPSWNPLRRNPQFERLVARSHR
jgi:serine/threonine-protein kinase